MTENKVLSEAELQQKIDNSLICGPGYQLSDDNTSCLDIDECNRKDFQGYSLPNPCDPITSTCKNTDGSFNCKCRPGFKASSTGEKDYYDYNQNFESESQNNLDLGPDDFAPDNPIDSSFILAFDACVVDYDYYEKQCQKTCSKDQGQCIKLDQPLDFYDDVVYDDYRPAYFDDGLNEAYLDKDSGEYIDESLLPISDYDDDLEQELMEEMNDEKELLPEKLRAFRKYGYNMETKAAEPIIPKKKSSSYSNGLNNNNDNLETKSLTKKLNYKNYENLQPNFTDIGESIYLCQCLSKYFTGKYCEECQCQNNGVCMKKVNPEAPDDPDRRIDYCQCPEKFHGDFCEKSSETSNFESNPETNDNNNNVNKFDLNSNIKTGGRLHTNSKNVKYTSDSTLLTNCYHNNFSSCFIPLTIIFPIILCTLIALCFFTGFYKKILKKFGCNDNKGSEADYHLGRDDDVETPSSESATRNRSDEFSDGLLSAGSKVDL